jgi:hypothetical protein
MLRTTVVLSGVTGAPYYSTLHWGGNTAGQAQAAADAHGHFWNQLQARLDGAMVADVGTDVQQIDPATGQIIQNFVVTGGQVQFSSAAEPVPQATQALLQLRTGDYVNGRELRGRIFIPGITETDSILGKPDAALITALINAYDFAMLNGGTAAGGHVVYSRTHFQASIVQDVSVWGEFAVLRSRRD